MIGTAELCAAVSAAAAAAAGISLLPRRMDFRRRIAPYLHSGRSVVASGLGTFGRRGLMASIGAMVEASGDAALRRKIAQANVLRSVDPSDRVAAYRLRVGITSVGAGLAGGLAGLGLATAPIALIPAGLGFLAGASFWRGRLDRAIETRRALMRIELYTINQMLAMHIRAGAGVVAAVRRVVEGARGAFVDELAEALRLHRGGLPAAAAFRRVGEGVAEPHASRTLRALAAAEERGADVARALLALSEDVREGRREAIRRRATKRRAAMLLPVLGLLAPTLVLFVAAPLPWLVLHGFGTA